MRDASLPIHRHYRERSEAAQNHGAVPGLLRSARNNAVRLVHGLRRRAGFALLLFLVAPPGANAQTAPGYRRETARVRVETQPPREIEAALWRPAGAAETLLVTTEPEPAAPVGGVLEIARRRGMAIVFAGPALERAGAAVLGAFADQSRKSVNARRVLGHGAGAGANALAGAKSFDGLLLLDASTPAKPPAGPRVIEVWGSDAYWRASPRPAEAPGAEPKNLRRFSLAGVSATRGGAGNCAAPLNSMSAEPALRALLVALDEWAAKGAEPPRSRFAGAAGKSLVPAQALKWPRLGSEPPQGDRLAPEIDADGNETTGLRLPEQALPIATFTGWNAKKDKAGAACLQGAQFPFAATKAERERSGDARPSLTERYGSRAYFVATMRVVADKLVKERLLLRDDADAYVARAKTAPF